MIDLIDFQQNWLSYVMPGQLKAGVLQQMPDVLFSPCKEVVKAKNLMFFLQKTFA